MELEEVTKALTKNPSQWAKMFLDTQQLLDAAVTELASIKQQEGAPPEGTFCHRRVTSYIALLGLMRTQMFASFQGERNAKDLGTVYLGGKKCTDDDLQKVENFLEDLSTICKSYRELRVGTANIEEQVSQELLLNNPCNIQIQNQQGEMVMKFETVEEGLANLMRIVKWHAQQLGTTGTYRQFFTNWFRNYSATNGLLDRSLEKLKPYKDPDTIILQTSPNYIILTRIIAFLEYDSKPDLEYIEKHYTLDKFVSASNVAL